ncbi:MAG: hypothetical protein RMK29_08470 [Myxococcales bacterium]|nr:hypothetical protein [Myxococcota bacterium]MDW8281729.1 hypothetical protein [Myxococcales bacterium]
MLRVALCLLCLVPLSAGASMLVPRGEAVLLRQEAGELVLQPRLLVAARPQGVEQPEVPPVQTVRPPPLQAEGNVLHSQVSAGSLQVRLQLGWEGGAGFVLQVHAAATAPTWVRLVALELELDAEQAWLLGRDLRPLWLQGAAALGRHDPKWITLQRRGRPLVTLVGSDDLDGIQLRRDGSRLRLRLDLLAMEARPFFHFAACTDYWKDPNQRLMLPVRLLLPGEALQGRLQLYPGAALPLAKARFPSGRRAALVITDHADQTAAPTLRALAGGTSDTSDPRWGQGGLLGHGLAITKALWLRSGSREPASHREGRNGARAAPMREAAEGPWEMPADPERALLDELGRGQADESGGGRPQLDDPQVVQLADRLHAAGWEIIPHSATPMRDGRELTDRALQYFRRYGARTWIDHQPYTNCEALVNQGYREGHYGIADLLQRYGYRYAWSGLDAAPGDLNLLAPRRLDTYVPVLWPVGRLAPGMPDDLWLFRSMLSFVETQRFFELYGPQALDRLEQERGLHIAHTYLENIHPPGSWFGKRNLLRPGRRPREIVLDPRLESLLAALAARVARGSLWVPTLARLGDYLDAISRVSVVLDTDGSALIRSARPLRGATFVVPRAGVRVWVEGRPPAGLRVAGGETSFWVDLPAGRAVRVHLEDETGQRLSLLERSQPVRMVGLNR